MAQTKTAAHREGMTRKQHQIIDELAKDLKYGTLTLVFQDGLLVQIDRNEKIRLPRETADAPGE